MDVFGFLFFTVMLAIEIYQAYRLWRDPKGSWKKYTGRVARFRAKTKGTILGIFDIAPSGYENSSANYVIINKILISLFILLTIFLMIGALFSPK